MAKIILICGKICSGKTRLRNELCAREGAMSLSCDEAVLAFYPEPLLDKHDEVLARVRRYLFNIAIEAAQAGASVVLDWGFWRRAERAEASARLSSLGIACEWHYISISDADWDKCIARRNEAVMAGKCEAYIVDDGLKQKLLSSFEPPERAEIDVWHENRYTD